jgi:Tfp pilus assembly protein PilX
LSAVINILTRRLPASLRREDGVALVVALGMSVILGISGTTAVVYSTQNHTSAARSKVEGTALSLAEAGLASAYSTLYGSGTPTMPNAVPQRTVELAGGEATYYGVLNGQTWTLVGVGRAKKPGAAATTPCGTTSIPTRRRRACRSKTPW